jgi:hypothetical protein
MTRTSAPKAFLLSALLSGSLLAAQPSIAGWVRAPGAVCNPTVAGAASPGFGGYRNNSGSNSATLVCNFNDIDTINNKSSITTLNLHGYDDTASASITAQVCVKYWDITGGECTSQLSSGNSFTGIYTLGFGDPGSWYGGTDGDFGYIRVTLPPGTLNDFFGLFAST